jgi:uncharacterized protein (TIGR02452 family)
MRRRRDELHDNQARDAHHNGQRKRMADEAFQRKEGNRAVIVDTLLRCDSEPALKWVRRAHVCWLPGWQHRAVREAPPSTVQAEVRDADCVAVARELCQLSDAKVWMLNMASATCPGGGALSGCNAQEEHLCRCSDLLPQLQRAASEGQYPLHTRRVGIPDFSILVHTAVVVFKDPRDYAMLPRDQWFRVGVITAAADNVRGLRRLGPNAPRFIKYLLDVAQMQYCTHLVLSAWGCGAFGQSPLEVARCFQRALAQTSGSLKVVFAVKDDHNSEGNLNAFRTTFAT